MTFVLAFLVILVNILIDVTVLAARPAREVRLMAAVATEEIGPATISRRRTFRNRWYRTPSFVAGAVIVLAPHRQPRRPADHRSTHRAGSCCTPTRTPSGAHWLGTTSSAATCTRA